MEAKERLYLTADKKRLVAEGDPAGATLYAAPGDEIPESAAEMFGLVDGELPRSGKRGGKGEDKSRKDGGNKNAPPTTPGGGGAPETGASTVPPDDLTKIKGIGEASAKALAAAGIDSFAKLAAVNPETPPEVEGLGARVPWTDWVKAATEEADAAASAQPPASGLTITTGQEN